VWPGRLGGWVEDARRQLEIEVKEGVPWDDSRDVILPQRQRKLGIRLCKPEVVQEANVYQLR
jgi:hypothetical protein